MPFRDIVGHRRQLGLLARALGADALPPSLVFSGPDGIGKRRVALAVAQALNCLSPAVDGALGRRDACGTCLACSKIARRIHPDVLVIEPEDGEEIKVEAIRQVVGQVTFRPFEGRYRSVIIDRADQMNQVAQSALLKTLEEPPQRTVLVLVTAQPDTLLATIRSRCCHVRFAAIAPHEIARELVERHRFSEPDANAAAALAGGSFRKALDAGTAEATEARAVAVAVLREAARDADPRTRLAAGAALLQAGTRKGKDKSQAASDRGVLAVRLSALASIIRDVTVLSARASDEALVNLDIRTELESLTRDYDRARLDRAFSAVGRSLAAVERHNASPKIVVDWLAVQL
jgi:DNA polymerase-3 subunit delta'